MRNKAGMATREKILTAVGRILCDNGLDGLTVKAVCDEASIRPGSFYNIFASKEEAILVVVGRAIGAVDPHPAGEEPDHVDDLVEAYITFVTEEPTMARVYLLVAVGGLSDPGIGERIVRHHHARLERFTVAMHTDRPHLSTDDAAARTEALLAALNGYALHFMLDPDFDFAAHCRRLLSMEPA